MILRIGYQRSFDCDSGVPLLKPKEIGSTHQEVDELSQVVLQLVHDRKLESEKRLKEEDAWLSWKLPGMPILPPSWIVQGMLALVRVSTEMGIKSVF